MRSCPERSYPFVFCKKTHSEFIKLRKFIKPRCAGNGGRRSTFTGNNAMLPAHSAQKFWRETVSVWDVMWPRSNQWERAQLGRNFHLFNKKYYGIFRFGHVAPDVFFFHWKVLVLGLMLSLIPCAKRLDRDYRNTRRHHFHLFYLIREPGYRCPVSSRFGSGSRPGAHRTAMPKTKNMPEAFLPKQRRTEKTGRIDCKRAAVRSECKSEDNNGESCG